MPSFSDALNRFEQRRSTAPRTPAQASLVALEQQRSPIQPSSLVNDESPLWNAIFSAPKVVTDAAQRFATRITTPSADAGTADTVAKGIIHGVGGPALSWLADKALGGSDHTSARIRGAVGGGAQGAAENLSLFNVATTVAPWLKLPKYLAYAAKVAGMLGGGALAGQSLAHLEDAARNYDADSQGGRRLAEAAGMAGFATLGALPGVAHVGAPEVPVSRPRMRPPRQLEAGPPPPPPPPDFMEGEILGEVPPRRPPGLPPGPSGAIPAPGETGGPFALGGLLGLPPGPPSPELALPEIAGPPRTSRGAIPMPGEVRPFDATYEPFRTPEGYKPRVRRPDRAFSEELPDQPQPNVPLVEKPAAKSEGNIPQSEGNFRLRRPRNVMGMNVSEVLVENGQPFLVTGAGPGGRFRVPWDVVDILREQEPTLPTRPEGVAAFTPPPAAPARPVPQSIRGVVKPLSEPPWQESTFGITDTEARELLGETLLPDVESPPAVVSPPVRERPADLQAMLTESAGAPSGPKRIPDIEPVDAAELALDPATFQFKESDAAGVTGALRGVDRWEPTSPPIMVFEAADGRRFVADGHQRFNKYRELQGRGADLPPLNARVFREADGWSVPDMVRLAALRNVQEGSAKPLDIAKLIWNGGELTPDEMARVPKSMVVGDRLARGQALGSITDPRAQQMLINGEVDPEFASYVGKYISDPAQQLAALQKLAKADLDNLRQADDFVRELAEGDFEQQSIMDMFGGQDVAVPLAEQKAKLIDSARRALTERKAAFSGAVKHAGKLAQAGNQLVGDVNVANLSEAKKLMAYFDKFARAKGTHTNEAITNAARGIVRGAGTRDAGLRDILAAVERDLKGEPVAATGLGPVESPGFPSGRPDLGAEPPASVPEPGGRPEPVAAGSEPGRLAGVAPEAPPRPELKEANNGRFLAPEDKDYVFIKLERSFAEGNPQLRKDLQAAGYRYRRGHEAWFKNLGDMTHAQAEDEAAGLLGGVKGTDVLDTGEVQPRLPGDVGEARPSTSAAPEPQFEAPFSLQRELSGDRPVPTQTPLEELFAPAAKQTLMDKPLATVDPNAPTAQQLPPNTRSFLKRQLAYSEDEINAMSVDDAMDAAQNRVRNPNAPPKETPSGLETTAAESSAARAPVVSRAPEAPGSLDELLADYLTNVAPTKVQQMQRRMGEATTARGREKVPVEQTYRGGAPEESEMAVPRREATPYRGQTIKDVDAAVAAGQTPESLEELLMGAAAEKGAKRQEMLARRQAEGRLTEQEMAAQGQEPPPRETDRHPDRLHKGGLTRANVGRAHAMQEMLTRGDRDSVDNYARALAEQVGRENEQAFKWGVAQGQEGKRSWGDEFTRLKFDKDTGEYLGSGFGALEAMYRANPGLVFRSVGGGVMGAILADREDLDGPEFLAAVGGGMLAGAALNPANLRQIAQTARREMPTITKAVKKMYADAKSSVREHELKVRADRDYGQDIGKIEQVWRSLSKVDPHLAYDLQKLQAAEQRAVAAAKTPVAKKMAQQLHFKQALADIRVAQKIAEKEGFGREAEYLRRYADMFAGKPTKLAETLAIGKTKPETIDAAMKQVERHTYRILIGWAVDTAMVNITQVALALPRIGIKGVATGIAKGLTKAGKEEARRAGLHYERFTDLPTTQQGAIMEAIDKTAFAMMRWTDEVNRRTVYLGAKEWALARGHGADAAERFAQELVSQTQGIPSELAGNPYLHQLGPLRTLAKYPALWAELAHDILTHPDKRVAGRAFGYLIGAAGLSAFTGLNIMETLIPRLSFIGPVWDVGKSMVTEEPKHLGQFAGGEAPTHSVVEDLTTLVVPRAVKKTHEVVRARLPESVGGYGEGLGERPKIGRKGQDIEQEVGPATDIANLLGVTTEKQTASRLRVGAENVVRRAIGAPEKEPGTRAQAQAAYTFEQRERQGRIQASDRAKRKLRDAIERGDDADIRAAEQQLTPRQVVEFYKTFGQETTERVARRLPRDARERFQRHMEQR